MDPITNLTSQIVYAVASSPETKALLEAEKEPFLAQTKGITTYTVLQKGEDPAGCALYTINEDVYVLLLVKGVVDVEAEITKLEAQKGKTNKSLEQLKERMSAPDYTTKVKQDARDRNEATLKSLQTELEAITTSMANFLKLK